MRCMRPQNVKCPAQRGSLLMLGLVYDARVGSVYCSSSGETILIDSMPALHCTACLLSWPVMDCTACLLSWLVMDCR